MVGLITRKSLFETRLVNVLIAIFCLKKLLVLLVEKNRKRRGISQTYFSEYNENKYARKGLPQLIITRRKVEEENTIVQTTAQLKLFFLILSSIKYDLK